MSHPSTLAANLAANAKADATIELSGGEESDDGMSDAESVARSGLGAVSLHSDAESTQSKASSRALGARALDATTDLDHATTDRGSRKRDGSDQHHVRRGDKSCLGEPAYWRVRGPCGPRHHPRSRPRSSWDS